MDKRELNYDQLGERLGGVDGKTIWRLAVGPHRGGMQMTILWMYKLAAALECHPSDLLPDQPPATLPLTDRRHLDDYHRLGEPDRNLVDSVIEGRLAASGAIQDSPPRRAKRGR